MGFLEFGKKFQSFVNFFWICSKRKRNLPVPHSIPPKKTPSPHAHPLAPPPQNSHSIPRKKQISCWGVSILTLYQPNPYQLKIKQREKNCLSPRTKRTNIPPISRKTNISCKHALLWVGTKGIPFNFSDNLCLNCFFLLFAPKKMKNRFFSTNTWLTNFGYPLLIYFNFLVGKDIVCRFIIEYSSLRDFGPLGSRSIFIWGFLKDDILACVETWD